MGVPQMWLNRRLRGEVALSIDDLAAVAQALDMPVEQLLRES
jgi:transcriptional regulator with XRE-family HTH domain